MKRKSIIVIEEKNAQCITEEFEIYPLLPNEVLVENQVSLISSGTELSRVFGIKKGLQYPIRLGYSSVGKIIDKGSNLLDLNIGDMVMYNGKHTSLQVFENKSKFLGIVTKLNDKLTPEEGSLLYLGLIVMNGVLITDIKLGDTVAIFGLGTLGLIASVLYKEAGCRVIGFDPIQSRCDCAKKLGIEETYTCPTSEQKDIVMKLTNNKGAEITVDTAGVSQAIENAILSTCKYGQVILLGSPRQEYITNASTMLNAIHMKMLHVKGALNELFPFEQKEGSTLSMKKSLDYLSNLMISKKLDASKIISHIINPENIMEAYYGLMNDKEHYSCVVINWKDDKNV